MRVEVLLARPGFHHHVAGVVVDTAEQVVHFAARILRLDACDGGAGGDPVVCLKRLHPDHAAHRRRWGQKKATHFTGRLDR